MANKFKKHLKPGKPVSPNKGSGNTTALPKSLQHKKDEHSSALILFDKKTKLFLLLMIALYLIMSLSKIHTSSVGIWDQMFGKQKSESILIGTPKPIRQDEWMVSTPALVGQYHAGMPVSNMTMGDGNVPLITGFPIKDFSMLIRPNLWSYFIFDVERAFAFSWNFNIFFFIISSFLLFMLLTRSNFWICLFGAFFIFLSGAMQWWSYALGSNMLWMNGLIISFIYLLYSKNIRSLSAAGIIFLFSSYGIVANTYPAWQVPLVYMYMAIFIGYIIKNKDFKSIKEKIGLRIIVFSITSLALLFFLYHHYGLIKHTYDLMMNTAYSGKRTTNGGDLISGKLFSEFFGIYITDSHFPAKWLNICEASSFIMFFPVIFYCTGFSIFRSKKIDWLLMALSAFIIVLLIWILVGFPSFFSKLTLMSMSPVYRTLPVLGVANSVLLVCFLGNKELKLNSGFSWIEAAILAIAVFVFMRITGTHINESTDNFFSPEQITTVSLLMSAVYLLIRYKHIKFIQPALALILLGMNLKNIKINPVTSGLSPLLENPLVKATEEINRKDPTARWAVFGNQSLTNLLKVNGINVINGVKTIPLLKDMAVLDPSGKDNFIYNRYAHINMFYLIDMKDSILFKLNENNVVNDNYSIFMDPCSPRLKQLGVKYFLYTNKPQAIEIRCMTPVKDTLGLFIYKRNDP